MITKRILIYLLLGVMFLYSCSNTETLTEEKLNKQLEPEILYDLALKDLKNNDIDEAKIKFESIEKNSPLSNRAIQSKIMLAFIEYLKLNYNEAIYKLNSVRNLYPAYKDIDYAYYMIALCYYEQINNEELEGENNKLALENFNQVLNRFPDSEYAKDSFQKIILLKENIAAKNMKIALYYLNQNKYFAAINRYKIIIDDYDQTKFTPEALYSINEIYVSLGMLEDADKTHTVLKYNYPNSEWYNHSQNLFGNGSKKNIKGSIKMKILGLIRKNNEKK